VAAGGHQASPRPRNRTLPWGQELTEAGLGYRPACGPDSEAPMAGQESAVEPGDCLCCSFAEAGTDSPGELKCGRGTWVG